MLETQETLNIAGWLFGIFPALGVIYWTWLNRGESWRWSVLICGFLLVGLGTWMAELFIEIISHIEIIQAEKPKLDSAWVAIKNSSTVWLFIFPATAMGIGVNLISSFLTTKKPDNIEDPNL
ncbi:hypothetical protein [Allochromatium vinosum]|uniref:hypothetical protein n=1 Tax=Allochromatium vinosum TaxID=1049 RepID=UPI0011D1067C|nr:hypothetical protein [Allochromatium vinosum]